MTEHTGGPFPEGSAPRRGLRRLVRSELPPTEPMRLVDRLAGSPYANPTIQVGGPDASARRAIDFALRLAETLFRFGAGALEVETSVIAVTAAFGLRSVEVDVTNQSVSINHAPKNATPISVLRVVRSSSTNYAGLVELHRLVTQIATASVTLPEAERRLQQLLIRPKPYPRWLVQAARAVFAGCIVTLLGGGPWGALIAAGTAVALGFVDRACKRWRVPEFFTTAFAAALVTGIALFFLWLQVPVPPGTVITGGILLLLPTARLVSAVQDGINGFPVTAAGRFLTAFLTFTALVAGIGVATAFGVQWGVGKDTVSQFTGVVPPIPVVLLLVAGATVLAAVTEQTLPRLLLPTACCGLAGYAVFLLMLAVGVGPRLAPAIAATAVGVIVRLVSLRLGAPPLVMTVPSILFLLTGLSIFRAMFAVTVAPDAPLDGVVGLFNALVVVLGVAAGVVLGDTLARPIRWRPRRRI
ncbi:threonine/serine ThrE exporter family protein [Psychromicrobium xiongbiense]|uniref:threonine/serine ThrE exporter family protein n=1 Tax=Psychromicrobium xiongbiense TaxID=3051184 RepID=UPI0025539C71|nr:threonine/serine exporter family protein [Psychromicrobium sp. YIM S02556]